MFSKALPLLLARCVKANFSFQCMITYSMQKLTGDLLSWFKFLNQSILPTPIIVFLHDMLGEVGIRSVKCQRI